MPRPDVAVFIDPFTHHFERNGLFDLRLGAGSGDDILAPWTYLRDWLDARGVHVHTADLLERGEVAPSAQNVFLSLGLYDRYPRLARRPDVSLSGFFALECPIVEPKLYRAVYPASKAFKRVFSFSEPEAIRPFLTGPVATRQVRLPQALDHVREDAWRRLDRRFLVMINANKLPRLRVNELYTERLRAVEYFERLGEIDLYGVGWDGPAYRVGKSSWPGALSRLHHAARTHRERILPSRERLVGAARRAYRGPTNSKSETLASYTFAICFENMTLDGWVTEKIFDCLAAGTVPVYLGAPDVDRWVDPDCFIDMRRFSGYPELREYLHQLGPSELQAYREAGREYFRSERYRPFTKQAFAELVGEIVSEDTDTELEPKDRQMAERLTT